MLQQTGVIEMAGWFSESEPKDARRAHELELVRRAQSGDESAFRDLVERHQAKVFSLVHRILRNREDAEDIAQLVFTKVYFALQRFDCRCSLLTWICKIALNECYSHFRKRRAQKECELDALDLETMPSADAAPAADSRVAMRDFVRKLMGKIPEEERLLLVLKEVEGHSIGELAQMTGSSESAIKTKLFRARHKLVEAAGRLSHRPAPEFAH
jgi:RNA polymerase sigma-70 factor (ECF subfamily)